MRKVWIVCLILIAAQTVISCGSSNRCGGKRDCNGVKKTYNKAGGFWM